MRKEFFLIIFIILIGCDGDLPDDETPIEIELVGALETMILKSENRYKLIGDSVTIPAGKILTIEAGTVITAELPTTKLVIDVFGKIIADGTPTKPIIFTSDLPISERSAGDWGGVIIKGNAVEDPSDSSGVLKYVRIEFAGSAYGDGHLNGISFDHVGSGTVVDGLQIFETLDDAIEFYGGNVDLRHVIVSGFRDDGIDWISGYNGTIRNLIVIGDDRSDRGIEGDNHPDAPNQLPRSDPKIYNATIIGTKNEGIILRNGTSVTIKNTVVMNCRGAGIGVDQISAKNSITLSNNIFHNNHPNFDLPNAMTATLEIDPKLDQNFQPRPDSPALDPKNADPKISDFVGAIGVDNWMIGWTER